MAPPSELRAARLNAWNVLFRAGKLNFKPVSSAKWVSMERTWAGKMHVRIEHDIVRGCTPEMMRWWFENLGRKTTWDGKGFDGPEVSFYHLWHHRDHVAVTPLGVHNSGFAVGESSLIQEQFNDFHDKVNVKVFTNRLDDEGFTFIITMFGISVGRLIHRYCATPSGACFYAETEIGLDIPVLGWLLNWFCVPFLYSKTMGENWIRHNIEETGRSEDVIPPLYEHYNRATLQRNDQNHKDD